MNRIELLTESHDGAVRLDVFISRKNQELTRSYIQKLIEGGMVRVDGQAAKASLKLKPGQIVEIFMPDTKPIEAAAQDIPIDILYEDDDIIVVNKPRGMVVHPACGNTTGTLVNAILHKCDSLSGINGVLRPGIVHRIDKDTTGILVIAKNDNAHIKLSEQLKEHTMKRNYLALVYGVLKSLRGTIDAPIGRHRTDRKRFAVVPGKGKRAVTHYDVIEFFDGYTLIKASLETGRTHQIRVHMSHIGHPLVGDELYGPKKPKIKAERQMLHAETLGFIHPVTENYIEFNSPLPEDFKMLLSKLTKL